GAAPEISRRLLDNLSPSIGSRLLSAFSAGDDDTLHLNHVLLALAWAGNEPVRAAFALWRANPPSWAKKLHVPPHEYALEAGWELDGKGQQRDLFLQKTIPLIPSHQASPSDAAVKIWTPSAELCEWCHQPS